MRITFNLIKTANYNKSNNNKKAYVSFPKNNDTFIKTQPTFQGMKCSESNFRVKDIEHLHCPVCGLLMLNKNQQKVFISDVSGKKGEELALVLEKYEDESVFIKDETKSKKRSIYRLQKQEIVNIIKDLARKNPDLNLAQLVQLKANECLASLIEEQMEIVDELEAYIENALDDEELVRTKGIIEEYKNQIHGKSPVQFKRKNFIHALSKVSQNETTQKTITEIISKLPTSDTSIDSFFIKYSKDGRTSKEIAGKFIAQNLPTAEHLIPKSKGGKDNTGNYICDCADCNSSRGNLDFNLWQKEKPMMKQYLQEHLFELQDALDKGELNSDYDNYIDEIIQVISDLSNGEIQLTTPTTNNDEKYKAMVAKRKVQVDELEKKIAELYIRRKEVKKEISQLEQHPQYQNIVQYGIVQAQIKKLTQEHGSLNNEARILRETRTKLNSLYERIVDFEKDYQEHPNSFDTDDIFYKTEGKTSQEVKLQIAENKAKEASINSRITQLSAEIDTLIEKRNALNEAGLPFEQLEVSIKDFGERLQNMENITKEINDLKETIFDESLLLQRLANINFDNSVLEQELNILKSQNDINEEEAPLYVKFLHYSSLFEQAQLMEEDATNSAKKEIAQIAQQSLRESVFNLYENQEVEYFINKDTIRQNEEEKEIIQARLSEIEKVKEKIAQLTQELNTLGQGRTIDEISLEYQELLKQKEIVDKIRNISELRTEAETLKDTIEYNKNILKQLRAYRIMPSEEFKRLVSLIY